MMYSSYGVYPADYASAESYDAFEAQAQYAQSFWSPAGQPAFHNYTYNQDYTQYSGANVETDAAWSGKQVALQCGVNLSDYSDFSDSESEPSTPTAPGVLRKDLPKSLSDGQIAVDDAASTDAASSALSDAASTAHVSDESDAGSDSDSCPSPKASKRVYTLDALMLVRVAVGMCASPPARWSTQPRDSASSKASGNGSEWRRGAAEQQQRNKLVTSASSWAAQQKKEQTTDEEVTRSLKSILNKLTIEKFDALYAKLIACGISKEDHVKLLVNEVFEKACLQHHFIDMYADLCMKLDKWLDDSQADVTATKVGFRRILLNQCQTSFEDSLHAPSTPDQDMAEDERLELAARQKQRVLGNTRLIGALLNRGMLSPRVLLSCANELLKDPAAQEALESLAALLTAVGPTFDDKEWSQYGMLSAIFDRVEGLTQNKQVAPRLRFLLRDVLDLRATSWANMKKVTAKQAGPMKLEEVHSLAAKEEEEQALMAQKKAAGKGSRKNVESFTLEPKLTANSKGKSNPKPAGESKQTGNAKAKNGRDEPKAQRPSQKKASSTTEGPKSHSQVSTPPVSPKNSPSIASSPKSSGPSPKSSPPASPITSPTMSPPRTAPFDLRAFRRELTEVIKELSATRDTARARRRFDGVKVPSNLQANEFSNLLTRVAEERCSASRRAMFAFVAGLAGNAFDKDKCADGVKSFFEEDFHDLCEEIPRLPEILKSELVPTMRAALPAAALDKVLPAALK